MTNKDSFKTLGLTSLEWSLIAFVGLMVAFFLIHGNVFEAVPRILMYLFEKLLSAYLKWETMNIVTGWRDSLKGLAGK